MVMQNAILKELNAYLELIKLRAKLMNPRYKGVVRKGNRSKQKIVAFYKKYNCWPQRTSEDRVERSLATKFENFVSPTAPAFDEELRRIALSSGRKTNGKRKHNVQGFKKEILSFVEEHGRVPTTASGEKIPGEGNLRHKLDYYTKQMNDTSFLGLIYKGDKCHKSGIPMKFRKVINQNIDLDKPLVRLVKD